MTGTRANQIETDILGAMNGFLRDNNGRAPRLIKIRTSDWEFMSVFLKDHRDHDHITLPPIDPAKIGGAANFVLFGLPVIAGGDGLEGPMAVAT